MPRDPNPPGIIIPLYLFSSFNNADDFSYFSADSHIISGFFPKKPNSVFD